MIGRAREDRGKGIPLTDEERQQRHFEEYGEWLPVEELPERGSGLEYPIGEERREGVPLTDEERAERHEELYGEEELPERGSGLEGIDETGDWIEAVPVDIDKGIWLVVGLGIVFVALAKKKK